LREAKPRNKILNRCKALATMLLICALYDKFADIVMPRSKTYNGQLLTRPYMIRLNVYYYYYYLFRTKQCNNQAQSCSTN